MIKLNVESLREQVLYRTGRKLIGISYENATMVLCKFAKSADPELRMRALEKMGEYKSHKVISCLIDSLQHEKDSLALIAAMETAGLLRIKSAVKLILQKLSHRDYMVRGYAAVSLSYINNRIALKYLAKLIKNERSSWAKAMFCVALYIAGNHEVLNKLLDLLQSRRYRVRSVIVNSLPDMELGGNKDFVISILKYRLKTEKTVAVSSSIKNTLKILEHKSKKSKK